MPDADLHFYFDPVCPFAWMASKWVRLVVAERDYTVDWRFISLRQVNAEVDYDSHFPPQYEAGHTAGLRLLRVAAAARARHGRVCVGPLYAVLGKHLFETEWRTDRDDESGLDHRGTPSYVAPILAEVGLPQSLVEALEDDSWDMEIRAETDEALALTGKDVGTPIIHVEPPDGVAFFGPVISRLPDREDAVAMWDHVLGLARVPGFAELKAASSSAAEKPPTRQRTCGPIRAPTDYYRRLAGEHDDWDEYRESMRRERRVLIRVEPTRAGPDRTG